MEGRPIPLTQRDSHSFRLDLGDLRRKRGLWRHNMGTPPISRPTSYQSSKYLNASLSQDDVAVRPTELARRLVLQLHWTTMDKVRQLCPGLSGRTLLRYRNSRSWKLSLSLCILLPVRRGKQDPCTRLVCTIVVSVVRTS